MAGLWERVKQGVDDNVPVHLIVAGYKAYLARSVDGTQGATRVEIRDKINGQINTPLSATEQTDLNAIADKIDGLIGAPLFNTLPMANSYVFNVEWLMVAAEMGSINETEWRSRLGIGTP